MSRLPYRSSAVVSAFMTLIAVFLSSPGTAQNNASFSLKTASTNQYAAEIVAADLNADGMPDLIETYSRVNPVLFSVQMGQGNGAFAKPVDYKSPVQQQSAAIVLAADLNRDSKVDVVVLTGIDVLVYLGRGDGTLDAPKHSTVTSFAGFARVEDFNHDGNPDLAIAITDGVAILYGDGAGSFSAPVRVMTISSTQRIGGLEVGDFNSYANVDIAIAVRNQPCDQGGCKTNDVHILFSSGSASFSDRLAFAGIVGDYTFSSGDLNHDGRTDLVGSLARPTSTAQNMKA